MTYDEALAKVLEAIENDRGGVMTSYQCWLSDQYIDLDKNDLVEELVSAMFQGPLISELTNEELAVNILEDGLGLDKTSDPAEVGEAIEAFFEEGFEDDDPGYEDDRPGKD